MKKIISTLLVVAIAASFSASMAQTKLLSLGVKAGMNFSSVSQASNQIISGEIKSRPGLTYGLFAEVRPMSMFSVTGELLYSGQGAKQEFNIAGVNTTVTQKLGYFNIPIMANYYVIDNLAIKAGVQYGFNVTATTSTEGISTDVKDQFKSADVAIPVGVSYNLLSFVFDARYTFGLTDVSDGLNPVKTKNKYFSLSVGYRF